MMDIRQFRGEDYHEVCSWWEGHGWPCIPLKRLPLFGYMAVRGEFPICCAWAYTCDSGTGMAMIEWIVSNPNASARDVVGGLSLLLDYMTAKLNGEGFDFILTTCKQESLKRLIKKSGFTESDSGMTHLLRTPPH